MILVVALGFWMVTPAAGLRMPGSAMLQESEAINATLLHLSPSERKIFSLWKQIHDLDELMKSKSFLQIGDAAKPSISLKESEGFLDEPDQMWEARKQRHILQMAAQKELQTKCPKTGLSTELFKDCIEGCRQSLTATAVRKAATLCGHKTWKNVMPKWFCHAKDGPPDPCGIAAFWQIHYEPTMSCAHEQRMGYSGDGGKWVCDPQKIKQNMTKGSPCLVYSIGSSGRFDFEKSIHNELSPDCEIHTVDMEHWKSYGREAPPPYVNYHVHKIGQKPDTPVSELVSKLGHTNKTIDLFKIDCEGCEWTTYKDWFDGGNYIRQILIELHGKPTLSGAHEMFNHLFDKGYVIYHKEPNIAFGSASIEYGLVKMSPDFARAKHPSTHPLSNYSHLAATD